MNRFLIVAIAAFLMLGLTGSIFPSAFVGKYSNGLLFVAKNLAIIMMLVNGTFMSSRYVPFAVGLVLMIILGMLFKILHYEGADELLSYPFAILWILYLTHFVFKKEKGLLDILKVILLFAFLAPMPLVMLHLVSEETYTILFGISDFVVVATFLYFFVSGYRQNILFDK